MLKEFILKQFPIRTGEEFAFLPKFKDRAWEDCNEKEDLLELAKEICQNPIPQLTASMFLDFYQTGSRAKYEGAMIVRRNQLLTLALAQCIHPDHDFMTTIADYIWEICEETSWTPPAHNNHYYTHYPDEVQLPRFDADRTYVDLVSGNTGALLSLCYYLFTKELDELCPQISQRLIQRVRDRLVLPILNYDDFGWMGLSAEGRINNWNPWIVSNGLVAAICLPLDKQQKRLFLNKSFLLLDQFIAYYYPDGGCDEGPTYFLAAGGALMEALYLIDYVTEGHVSVFDQPLIKNIAQYIERAAIFDNTMANFGDNGPVQKSGSGLIYRMGKAVNSEQLIQYGLKRLELERQAEEKLEIAASFSMRLLNSFLFRKEMEEQLPSTYQPELSCLMEDVMIVTARQKTDGMGFSIAAKGGHNDESHNHNDIGQVMVYLDKQPVIVDPGNCTYTAKTFSPQRYEIPVMQSGCHNLPTVNGCMQQDGREYEAVLVGYEDTEEKMVFSVEIGKAYPKEAGIKTLQRTTTLDRKKEQVIIQDDFSAIPGEIIWNLMVPGEPVVKGNQLITKSGCVITLEGLPVEINVSYAQELEGATQRNWDGALHHVTIKAKTNAEGCMTIILSRG